jgi:2-polyprenyl-3-methyl-5-hydroxy-6-metoxy-1,4-benzoquinol methylase
MCQHVNIRHVLIRQELARAPGMRWDMMGKFMESQYSEWGHTSSDPGCTWRYVLQPVLELCADYPPPARVLDVGCGNGYLAGQLLQRGYRAVGIDLSESGIATCRATYPQGRFEILSADDRMFQRLGERAFDIVVSTEVIEHLYDPVSYAHGCFSALRPGGRFICSTPYHGYLKNLALSVTGKWDNHFNPMWLGGHIKFWSPQTLGKLMREMGLVNIQFRGAGRAPFLWMSMIMSGDRPQTPSP